MAALGRASTRADSTRRRSAGSSAARSRSARLTGADTAHDGERARHRGLDGVGPLRLPRGRDGDEADPPGLGGARRHPRLAARRARGRRPAVGPRGQVRALPRLPRRGARARSTSTRSSPTSARAGRRRGSPTSRSRSATSCTARSARRPTRSTAGRSRRTRSPTCSSPSRRPASRSCSSRPTQKQHAALGLRGQVLAPVLGRLDARPRPRRRSRLLGRGDRRPGRAGRRGEGRLRDAGVPDLPAGVPGRRPSSRSPTARRSSATSRTRRAAPRTRCRPTRCARSSAATPRSRSPDDAVDALEEAILALRGAGRPGGRARAADGVEGAGRRRDASAEPQRRAAGDRRRRPRVRRPRRDPGRVRARARATSSRRRSSRRCGAGAVRDDDPGGVRRPRARARHLRADRDGALAGLGDAVRDHERVVHRGRR